MKKIASLWKKQGKKGPYLAGTIGDFSVMVFPNDRKTQANHPDYNVFLAEKEAKPAGDRPAPTRGYVKPVIIPLEQQTDEPPADLWDRSSDTHSTSEF